MGKERVLLANGALGHNQSTWSAPGPILLRVAGPVVPPRLPSMFVVLAPSFQVPDLLSKFAVSVTKGIGLKSGVPTSKSRTTTMKVLASRVSL